MRALALVIAGGIILMTVGYNEREALTSGTGLDAVRLTDPTTGAGLLTTNTDPTVAGVDPLTGADAPEGTDVGFGSSLLARIADGVYNGDLAVPPPQPSLPLMGDPDDAAYNPLPYWRHVPDPTGRISASWSDGVVTFAIAAGPGTASRAWLEQLVRLPNRTITPALRVAWAENDLSGTPSNLYPFVEAQYLDASLAVTGDAGSSVGVPASTQGIVSAVGNPSEQRQPSDARYLRVRVGALASGTGAGSFGLVRAWVSTMPSIPREQILRGAILAGDSISDWGGGVSVAGDLRHWASVFAVTVTGTGSSASIGGLDTSPFGRVVWIHHFAGTESLVLLHEDSGSSAQNRFRCPNGSNLTLRPYGTVMLCRFGDEDNSVIRWRVMSQV